MKNITDYFLDLTQQNMPEVEINSSCIHDTGNIRLLDDRSVYPKNSKSEHMGKKVMLSESDYKSNNKSNIKKRKNSDLSTAGTEKNILKKKFINECALTGENQTISSTCSDVITEAVFSAKTIALNKESKKELEKLNFKICNNFVNYNLNLDAKEVTDLKSKRKKRKNEKPEEFNNNERSCTRNVRDKFLQSQSNKKQKLDEFINDCKNLNEKNCMDDEEYSNASLFMKTSIHNSGDDNLIGSKTGLPQKEKSLPQNNLFRYFSDVNKNKSSSFSCLKSENKTTSTAKRKAVCCNESECTFLDKMQSPDDSSQIRAINTTAQLAPLFFKKQGKSTVKMSNKLKQEFLNSGAPDIIRKKMSSLKNNEVDQYNGEYNFPVITHVGSISATDNVLYALPLKPDNLEELKNLIVYPCENIACLIENSSSSLSLSYHETVNVACEITALNKREPHVDVLKIYSFLKNMQETSNLTRKVKDVNTQSSWIGWTEKYRPVFHGEILGNATSVNQLKSWIEKYKHVQRNDNEYNSEDEFLHSDDNSNGDIRTKDNVAVLVGPSGCGKTCAVYTIARELGFEVLEINAGHNRTGKRILSELLESTQSHQVKRENKLNMSKKNDKSNHQTTQQNTRTMSLILIEDADILFENYDEGYLSAINSLIELSKRPIIFTVNEIYSPHIAKYNNTDHLVLHFTKPSWSEISVWLQIIALIEGTKLTNEMLHVLLNTAGTDIRKNLLQLQMLISSKICFPLTALDHSTKFAKDKRKKGNSSTIKQEMEQYCSFLREMSNVDILDPDNKYIFEEIRVHKTINYTSSDPRYSENYFIHNLQRELHNYCSKNLQSRYYSTLPLLTETVQQERRRRNVYISSKSALSNIVPKYATRYVGIIDYLPTIRAISRLEDVRLAHNTRRTSRYFNYLKSIDVYVSDTENRLLISSLT